MNDGTPMWYSLVLFIALVILIVVMFDAVNMKLDQLTQDNSELIECRQQNNELILYTNDLIETNDSLLNHINELAYEEE